MRRHGNKRVKDYAAAKDKWRHKRTLLQVDKLPSEFKFPKYGNLQQSKNPVNMIEPIVLIDVLKNNQ